MQRSLVSYEDISLPYQGDSASQSSHALPSKPPPSKKRKSNPHAQHRDDRGSAKTDRKDESAYVDSKFEDDEDSEGRELTYEEIWDDSALIDAWNAAAEEYEIYHGPDKDWKQEPVNKSPLWWNVPSTNPKKEHQVQLVNDVSMDASTAESGLPEANDEGDSQPLNFDTFVPTHDPSLDLPVPEQPPAIPGPDYSAHYLPDPPGSIVSRDEAFSRALGAMYWGGYWTAMYHCQSNASNKWASGDEDGPEDLVSTEIHAEGDAVADDETFVSTQRS